MEKLINDMENQSYDSIIDSYRARAEEEYIAPATNFVGRFMDLLDEEARTVAPARVGEARRRHAAAEGGRVRKRRCDGFDYGILTYDCVGCSECLWMSIHE